MSDMLHQLENNEAILLMYIAGELPDEERREVEQMLSRDESLRHMHDEIRSAWESAMGGIEHLDAGDALAVSRDAAARNVGRMVRNWHAQNARSPGLQAEASAKRSRKIPWWAASFSTAAAVFVGFLVWWGLNEPDPNRKVASTNDSNPAMTMMWPRGGGGPLDQYSPGQRLRSWLNADEPGPEGTFNVVAIDATGVSSQVTMSDLEVQISDIASSKAGPTEPVFVEW